MNNLKIAACLLFETLYWEFVVNLKEKIATWVSVNAKHRQH